ncbi:tripartite motif-containing protein 65 [Perognathus longimembris pacificus]|uniref:tripartite motif-containing protein 65 n=1 Tax=Perognathus longimembris pacificus TaxID=214514 RepID=UPI00201A1D19|nr:tripartite motif-containing protein 65 [Perognathus longimembris pacificus]
MEAVDAEQLTEKLCCAICLGLYRDPVTLPCGHNFCGDCIRDSWRRCEQACPECREPCPAGAAPPRRNVALSQVMELLRGPRPAGPGPAPAERAPAAGPAPAAGHAPARCPLELVCRTEDRCACCACAVRECRLHEPVLLHEERRQREGQLRARLEVTRQRTAQAETQLQELRQQTSQIQGSACTLASVVSSKFSCLQQALEKQQASALESIETAKARALAQIRDEERRLRGHLEALALYGHRVHSLLEQADPQAFLQESQQLLEPPEPLGPRPPPQWDADGQLSELKEHLSPLWGFLLEERRPPKGAAKTAQPPPTDTAGPPALASSMECPLRKQLRQYYRNLTFDPASANRHFSLSHEDQRVTHCRQPQRPAKPGSFEFWQVQCAQSFQTGRHYWEVLASDHSVTLGVTYPGLARCKQGTSTDNIGRGPESWGLCIQEGSVQAWHKGKATRLPPVSGRLLGMELDLASGYLTFYSLKPRAQALHTFNASFNRPVFPVFWLLEGRTLTLCHQPGAQEAEI